MPSDARIRSEIPSFPRAACARTRTPSGIVEPVRRHPKKSSSLAGRFLFNAGGGLAPTQAEERHWRRDHVKPDGVGEVWRRVPGHNELIPGASKRKMINRRRSI
jgi:hypothetical protein